MYQDSHTKEKRMLLLLNAGFFMNFKKSDSFYTKNPGYTIGEVELGVNYVLIILTNAGTLGIQYRRHCSIYFFKTLPNYCIRRIKHYISALASM
jgi:hypothetical protein